MKTSPFCAVVLLTVAFASILSTQQATAEETVLVDSTYEHGNGSFEFDDSGEALTDKGQPGAWVGAGELTIDGTDTIAATTRVTATKTVASDGSFSLQVRPNPAERSPAGGILDTGYALKQGDQLNLTFDWQKTDNFVGGAKFDVFVFTSSDDSLDGTLTSIASKTFAMGPPQKEFESASFAPGDFTITDANVGKKIYLSFSAGGYTRASNSSRFNIDNIRFTAESSP
ncbi:hypothetical protein LF1_24570 [Rubripirellula obstinata]|uniref:Carbohydrate binding domain protein n=1 Tax=Rubripirellula obstinata TaxID=406547 RepID=A0A5B1CK50_9BACT|nr:hypothetical protein [Rubripirellula obstinata]KAA1259920.1 hypothetical protein LF1_24570 [Rubripirellula obstinata]